MLYPVYLAVKDSISYVQTGKGRQDPFLVRWGQKLWNLMVARRATWGWDVRGMVKLG